MSLTLIKIKGEDPPKEWRSPEKQKEKQAEKEEQKMFLDQFCEK